MSPPKKAARKDSSAPKRPQSAYMIWMQANRKDIAQEGEKASETAKKAGVLWKTLSEQQKQVWLGKAKEDKERYAREMDTWMKRTTVSALPDDVLPLIFKHFPSFSDKFRLASVSQQFRRCVLKDLKTPRPLVIDFPGRRLAGQSIHEPKWPLAVQLLAPKAQFSSVVIKMCPLLWEFSLAVMQELIASDCLGALTRFEHDLVTRQELPLVSKIVATAPKLSAINCTLSFRSGMISPLVQALKDKAIEEMTLKLDFPVTNDQLIELFQAPRPNTVKKLSLQSKPTLYGTQLFPALENDAWSALETLHYSAQCPLTPALLETFNKFPKLSKITFAMASILFPLDAADSIVSQLKMVADRPMASELTLAAENAFAVCGCQLIVLIRRVQFQVPGVTLEMDTVASVPVRGFCPPRSVVKFTSKNCTVTIRGLASFDCQQSVECSSFYTNLLATLFHGASRRQTYRLLAGHLLDKCRVGGVVEDLKKCIGNSRFSVVSAVLNQDGEVTVTCRRPCGSEYYVYVPVHNCFNRACVKCWLG